ncbi:MAG: hypothetical protein HC857_17865 [Synechococcales cyanobacterium RU_4_20]|nr:hypothetical protein [Synechococcales cyanobacterium RU_4_20]
MAADRALSHPIPSRYKFGGHQKNMLIVALSLILLIAWIVRRNNKLSGKLKVKDLVEAELNTERTLPNTPTPASGAGATLNAKTIQDAQVINADQTPAGQAALNADTISGSTVVNATGPVNIGSILGVGSAGRNPTSAKPSPDEVSLRQKIAIALADLFELEEIETLCFDLDIDAEEIKGQTKSAKAHALVNYCENRGRLSELAAAIRARRSNAQL